MSVRTVLIKYERPRIHFGKMYWSGIFEDTPEGYDYHSKEQLKHNAETDGYKWKVLRLHRDGSASIVESSEGRGINPFSLMKGDK